MKRIINGFEVDCASERVFAERQSARTMDICLRSPPIGNGLYRAGGARYQRRGCPTSRRAPRNRSRFALASRPGWW
jgi:hypothetical protein